MAWHFLLQGIFPTQGSSLCLLGLLHWQAHSLPLHHHKPIQFLVGLCRVFWVFWGRKKKWLRATDVIAEGKKAWRFTGVRADAFVRMPVFVFLFWSLTCGVLVPPWGIDPVPSALGTLNLSHWTTREVRMSIFCPYFRFPRNYPFLGMPELYAFLQSSELIWCKLYIADIQKNLYGAHKECTKGTDDVFYPQASISLQNSYAASKNT